MEALFFRAALLHEEGRLEESLRDLERLVLATPQLKKILCYSFLRCELALARRSGSRYLERCSRLFAGIPERYRKIARVRKLDEGYQALLERPRRGASPPPGSRD